MARWSVMVISYAAVAPALGGLGVAQAQTSPAARDGEREASSPQQVRNRKILADSETVFPMDDNLVLRGYANRRWIVQPAAVSHAVVMIHGVLRNPDNYYLPARRALERKSLFTKVALLSVGFDDTASAAQGNETTGTFRLPLETWRRWRLESR